MAETRFVNEQMDEWKTDGRCDVNMPAEVSRGHENYKGA